jgi:hypothetical protein
MVVDIAGRGQCRDVTAVHGAVIGKAQSGPAALMANCVPPLMGLHSADRSDRHPAMVGVGVGHHPLRPVKQHQARTPFGLDQPLPPGLLSGHLRDQRTEKLLVSGQLHQEPAHLVHIEDVAGTQLIQLSQEVAERARDSASAHRPTPDPRSAPEPSPRVVRSADASAMAAVPSSTVPAQSARHGSTVPTQFPGIGHGVTRQG